MKLTGKILTTGLVVGGAMSTLSVVNKIMEAMVGELDTVLSGEERRYPWKYGDMFYEVKGDKNAKPLLLIHSFGPGASSYEWRRNIDALAARFRVYAIDLLGFGLSDRPAIDYSAETFTDLIGDFMREVIAKPAIVVAHGITCAFVIAEAYRRPQLFERLVLVTPPASILQEQTSGPLNAVWKAALRLPVLGQFTYNMLTTRRAIRSYYDRQGYHNPSLISDELVEYIFTSAHQPNSRFALASFLSNYLTMDVHEALARLQMPVAAVWGREDPLTPSEARDAFKRVNASIDVRIIDKCYQQPQDEQSTAFNGLVNEFAGAAVNR